MVSKCYNPIFIASQICVYNPVSVCVFPIATLPIRTGTNAFSFLRKLRYKIFQWTCAMNDMSEKKLSCTVTFSHDISDGTSDRLEGTIHLFEYHYDETLPDFWFGVIELALDSIHQLEITLIEPRECVRLNVVTEDGRTALARYTRAHMHQADDGRQVFRIAVVGAKALKEKI